MTDKNRISGGSENHKLAFGNKASPLGRNSAGVNQLISPTSDGRDETFVTAREGFSPKQSLMSFGRTDTGNFSPNASNKNGFGPSFKA